MSQLIVRPSLREIRVYTVGARRRAILQEVERVEQRQHEQWKRIGRRPRRRGVSRHLLSMLVNPYMFAAAGSSGGTSRLASIVGSKLWLEAPIGGEWYKDGGVTAATANGDAIQQWSDVSGNSRHLFQPSLGPNEPTLDTSVTHLGFPTVKFTGLTVQWFTVPDASALTQIEIVYVLKNVLDPQSNTAITGLDHFGPSGIQTTHFPWTDSIIYDSFGTNARKTVGDPTPSLTSQFRTYSRRSSSGFWASYLDNSGPNTDGNGDACLFYTNSNTVSISSAPLVGASEATTFKFDGWIACVAIFSSALTTSERAAVYTALTT